MTDNSNKVRALILSALMVFSVFAGTVAFAGTAAAEVTTADANNVAVGQDSTVQTVTASADSAGATIEIDASNATSAGASVSSFDVSSTGDDTIDSEEYYPDNSTIRVTTSDGSDGTTDISVDITHDTTGLSAATGVDYNVTDGSGTNSLASFDAVEPGVSDVTISGGNTVTQQDAALTQTQTVTYTVADSEDEEVSVDISEALATGLTIDEEGDIGTDNVDGAIAVDSISLNENDETITFNVSDDTSNGEVHADATFDLTIDFNASDIDSDNRVTHTFTDAYNNEATTKFKTIVEGTMIDNGTADAEVFAGEMITFENTEGDVTSVEIYDTDSDGNADTRVANLNTSPGDAINYDSGNLEAGDYIVEWESTTGVTNSTNLTVSDLGLTAELQSTSVTNEESISVDLSSNNPLGDYTAHVYEAGADISSDDPVATQEGSFDGSGESSESFAVSDYDDIEAGSNYTVVVEHDASGVTNQTDEVEVTTAAEGDSNFAQGSYSVEQGGIAEINISLTGGATDGTLVIGQEDQSGYNANVSFTDGDEDGQVTILFNTYQAGNTSAEFVTAAGDDDTASAQAGNTSLNNGEDLLAESGYDIAVRHGSTDYNATEVFDNEDTDFSSLSVGPRSIDSLNLWTAPGSASADSILDATLTQDSTIATNDWVVHQLSATGLDGLVDANGNLSETLGNGLNVTVEQTEETTRANQNAKVLNVSESGDAVQLIADADNSSYYIAVNTEDAVFDRGSETAAATGVSANEDYTATLTVDDTKLVGEDSESINNTFEVVERSYSLDTTPVNVTAEADQNITGTTSVAPGTEIRMTIRSDSDVSPGFYNNPSTTVASDGTFTFTTDLSDASTGDTFSVTGAEGMLSADGNVVESTTEATATPEPTETATATPEPTETATPEPTETDAPDETDEPTETPEDDTTTTTTPGFGVAVALVALLAAALLAGRRE